MSFKVIAKNFSQTFDRWTDAVNTANALKPKLKGWFSDIRIVEQEEVVWVYGKSHAHPMYLGPGTYDRLAKLFVQEAIAAESAKRSQQPWQIRHHRFDWGSRTYLMGVLNVTPDSFSDGGQFNTLDTALAQAKTLVRAGINILDIGGQSTRPGAEQISLATEIDRVVPVIRAIRQASDTDLQTAVISVDTTQSVVAAAAVEAGADMINDISGGMFDPDMFSTVAALGVPYILMHIRGTPQTMQQMTDYDDVVAEIVTFCQQQIQQAIAAGVSPDQICVDPGIGFAKTYPQNLDILRRLSELKPLNCPILVGPSRKSFIGWILNQSDPQQRVWGTAAACCGAIAAGADILRIHDGPEMVDVCRVADAIWRPQVDEASS
ncbi:MAG: dihydropteroate synthase [Cyanobacteria bacterium P01_A01_bin.123]